MPRERKAARCSSASQGGGGGKGKSRRSSRNAEVEEEERREQEEEMDDDDDDEELQDVGDEDERNEDTEAAQCRTQMMDEDEEDDEDDKKVCEGQTLEQRRAIRQKLHEHKNKVVNDKQAMEQVSGAAYERNLQMSNKIFKEIKYTREAVVDADTLDKLATVPLKHAEKLASATKRYDYTQLQDALKNKFAVGVGNKFLDWQRLGACVAPCFRCVPEIDFMLGPLDKPPAARKERQQQQKRKRTADDNAEEVQPEQVTQQAGASQNANHEQVAAERVKKLKCLIEKTVGTVGGRSGRAREKEASGLKDEVDVFKFLFNPKSFTQTVENIFDLAFQCKEGAASFVLNKDKVPVIRAGEGALGEESIKKRQAVLTLTMKDWEQLCQAYKVEQCLVPDRPDYKEDANLVKMLEETEVGGQASGTSTGGSSSGTSSSRTNNRRE